MVIVTGTVVARPDTIDDLIDLCLEHVRRSRLEPGCLSHAVHHDVEDPLRLVFVERWADLDALRAHFAVPTSSEFVSSLGPLTAEAATIEIYEAEPTRP